MPKKLSRPLKAGMIEAKPNGKGNKFKKQGSPAQLKKASAAPLKGLMKKKKVK